MKTAILLHGICDEEEYFEMDFPSPSNAHWLPWLQQKFLRSGILCQALEMPKSYAPVYTEWADIFEQIKINPDTIIVGHSAGCGFILNWLNQHPHVKINKLILVAPWLDPSKRRGDFLKFSLDTHITQQIREMHVFYSTDETVEGVAETKDLILEKNPDTILHLFHDKDHFCLSDLGGVEFPELWDVCHTPS